MLDKYIVTAWFEGEVEELFSFFPSQPLSIDFPWEICPFPVTSIDYFITHRTLPSESNFRKGISRPLPREAIKFCLLLEIIHYKPKIAFQS